jgi:hypothetical protein
MKQKWYCCWWETYFHSTQCETEFSFADFPVYLKPGWKRSQLGLENHLHRSSIPTCTWHPYFINKNKETKRQFWKFSTSSPLIPKLSLELFSILSKGPLLMSPGGWWSMIKGTKSPWQHFSSCPPSQLNLNSPIFGVNQWVLFIDPFVVHNIWQVNVRISERLGLHIPSKF